MSDVVAPINKDVHLLLSFSADIDASYSNRKDYDLKQICHAIDNLFGENGLIGDDDLITLMEAKEYSDAMEFCKAEHELLFGNNNEFHQSGAELRNKQNESRTEPNKQLQGPIPQVEDSETLL